MALLQKGRYVARLAEGAADLSRARALRGQVFAADRGGRADPFDAACRHVLIEDARAGGRAVCTFRLLPLAGGAEIGRSYSAQFYGLEALERYPGPVLELGRFVIDPGARDADVLRLAWGALTRIVDAEGAGLLFGCASFNGTDAARYAESFAMLRARHLAPRRWRPRIKAPRVCRFGAARGRGEGDPREGLRQMPPLLRSYIAMGGWVSDHAVVDEEMGTLHVFTGLEIGAIPAARQRLLRAVAAG